MDILPCLFYQILATAFIHSYLPRLKSGTSPWFKKLLTISEQSCNSCWGICQWFLKPDTQGGETLARWSGRGEGRGHTGHFCREVTQSVVKSSNIAAGLLIRASPGLKSVSDEQELPLPWTWEAKPEVVGCSSTTERDLVSVGFCITVSVSPVLCCFLDSCSRTSRRWAFCFPSLGILLQNNTKHTQNRLQDVRKFTFTHGGTN